MAQYQCGQTFRDRFSRVQKRGCGFTSDQPWEGICPSCRGWIRCTVVKKDTPEIVKHTLASLQNQKRVEYIATGIPEWDRVLGQDFDDPNKCGFVKGGVYLVTGEKGCGKSTILMQSANGIATEHRRVLYVSGEQNLPDLALAAQRLNVANPHVHIESQPDAFVVTNEIYPVLKPSVVIFDSVNRIRTGHDGGPGQDVTEGSSTMIAEVVKWIVSFAKEKKVTVFMVGHLTKAGDIGGPEGMLHDVDCLVVLKHGWIKDPHDSEKILPATEGVVEISIADSKNRYGDAKAVSLMEMTTRGLTPLSTAALKAVARADKKKGKLELVTD